MDLKVCVVFLIYAQQKWQLMHVIHMGLVNTWMSTYLEASPPRCDCCIYFINLAAWLTLEVHTLKKCFRASLTGLWGRNKRRRLDSNLRVFKHPKRRGLRLCWFSMQYLSARWACKFGQNMVTIMKGTFQKKKRKERKNKQNKRLIPRRCDTTITFFPH